MKPNGLVQFSASYQFKIPQEHVDASRKRYDDLRGGQPFWIEKPEEFSLLEDVDQDNFSVIMSPSGEVTLGTPFPSSDKANNPAVVAKILQQLGFPDGLIQTLAKQLLNAPVTEDTIVLNVDGMDSPILTTHVERDVSDVVADEDTLDESNEIYEAAKMAALSTDIVDPNAVVDGEPLLVKTVLDGDFKTSEKLLSHPKININLRDDVEATALWHAADKGQTVFVEKLLECEEILINVVNRENEKGGGRATPLYCAAHGGYTDITRLLVNRDEVNVDLRQGADWLPTHVAVHNGHLFVLKVLLESGKVLHQLKELTPDGHSLLKLTDSKGFYEIKELLEAYGAGKPAKFKTERGLTKDCYDAIETNDMAKFSKTLMHPDFNPKKVVKETFPLRYAATLGRLNMVEALLRRSDVDVNQTMPWGCCALIFAAENGHLDVVKRLLKVPGINKNQRTTEATIPSKATALGFAKYFGHNDVVDLLREAGVRN